MKIFYSRRSIRKYKDMPLTEDQIDSLVKAALLSLSAMNMQSWHITMLTNRETILDWEKEIVQHFIDIGDTQIIEHNKARNNKIFYDAPAVFVVSMEENKGIDVGIVAQSIALAAKGMGLDSVILGLSRVSFEPKYADKWSKILKFPENHVYGITVAVGYGDETGKERKSDMSKVDYLE